jgi:UDP-N-acetylmuramate dehydrogenase
MEDIMNRRREKQPLEYPSAGSTFKRPEGNYASALVDQCGLKGLRIGGAMVSAKHAGFLINYDNATAADMRGLIVKVQDEVLRQTGYILECEVKMI